MKIAATFFTRLKGLMFSKELPAGHGLYIKPCRSIHTYFMNYPIDVIYLNEKYEIVGLDEAVQPRTIGKYHKGAKSVIELPEGTIQRTKTEVGHALQLKNS
nr:DUF192 domain-containing protein [Mesobacillus harenae]